MVCCEHRYVLIVSIIDFYYVYYVVWCNKKYLIFSKMKSLQTFYLQSNSIILCGTSYAYVSIIFWWGVVSAPVLPKILEFAQKLQSFSDI